jgi:hypothetical protein
VDTKTEALIRDLAEKLGTTTEHLWGVLVHQAMIAGLVEIIVMAAWVLALFVVFRILRSNTSLAHV